MDDSVRWLRMMTYLKAYRSGYTGTLHQYENEPDVKRTRIRSKDGMLLTIEIKTKSQ